MGAGNWRPTADDYEMVYVELDAEDEYDMLKSDLMRILPPSMHKPHDSYCARGNIFSTNGHCNLILADNEWSLAIAFVPHDDGHEGLHMQWIGQVAQKTFKRLHDIGWRLSVRCGPWTSGRWAA